ncbi:unnamed protein product [marine sediment metagenome]|uniref:Uncharacterized protein n=1 Tax=marine sediment metagenome TaxID=412755 RepID=X0ZDV0_9ZZZZ
MIYGIPEQLLKIASWRVSSGKGKEAADSNVKEAFIPTGMEGGGGGMPPGMAGGMPPMPPMPPVGAMGPADAGMGMPPGMPMDMGMGMPPEAAMGAMPPPPPPPAEAAPATTGGKGGSSKIDPSMIYTEMINVRRLLTTMFKNLGWELPPDVLDNTEIARAIASGESASAAPPQGGEMAASIPPPPEPPPAAAPAPPAEKQGSDGEISMTMGVPHATPSHKTVANGWDAVAALSRSLMAKRPSDVR